MVAYKGFGRINVPPANNSPSSVTSIQDTLKDTPATVAESSSGTRPIISKMEHIKRHNFPVLPGKNKDKDKEKEKDKESKKISQSPLLKPTKPTNSLDMVTESPPNMFLKGPRESSGALFSAQLLMKIVDPDVVLETFEMSLNVVVQTKKPVVKDCPGCHSKINELHQWKFIKAPKSLSAGEHKFPFSYLFPGHLPATTQGSIGVLRYYLEAEAKVKPGTSSSGQTTISMRREIPLFRAKEELEDRGHTRLFPPTNLAAYVTYPPVIHPLGEISVNMRINGCNDRDEAKGILYRWRLRKMSWKLEEKETMISPACPKHSNKVGGEGKGIQHEESRPAGRGDANSGWKTDISDGQIEMEFSCRPFANPRPLCDVDSPNGLKISHNLVIELVISEEWAKIRHPETAVPSGSARVLRMTFPVDITERAGLGVSWDEETPPVYEDVPASPPVYPQKDIPPYQEATTEATRSGGEMLDYTGPPLSPPPPLEEEIERFSLGESRHTDTTGIGAVMATSDPEQSASNTGSEGWGPRGARGGARVLNLEDFQTD